MEAEGEGCRQLPEAVCALGSSGASDSVACVMGRGWPCGDPTLEPCVFGFPLLAMWEREKFGAGIRPSTEDAT